MTYFSYNDYIECIENVDKRTRKRVEDNKVEYKITNLTETNNMRKEIIRILRNKKQLNIFLNDFLNLFEIRNIKNIIYCNNKKISSDIQNNILCKIKNKEIFIFIKVIEEIDNNITYKMFENSLNILKNWVKEEQNKNKRYPIVIPIVIYTGKNNWKIKNSKLYNNAKYIKCENNKIKFSYNMININEVDIQELKKMKSKIAEEILKNKYLQINQ